MNVKKTEDQVVEITVPALFDAHVHFREYDLLPHLVRETARYCDYAVVMPNTTKPVTTGEDVNTYYRVIMQAVPKDNPFTPLMTLYLTPDMTYKDIEKAKKIAGDKLVGVKLYPKGGTTNSGHGVPVNWLWHPERDDLADPMPLKLRDTFRAIANLDLVLNIHGEEPDEELLQRESKFVWNGFIDWYVKSYPSARVVLEHITTHCAIGHVAEWAKRNYNVGATITLHHMYDSIDDAYRHVHKHCWPPPNLRRERDMIAAVARIPREHPTIFLGSDSAPHPIAKKECAECACGCFTAPLLGDKLAEFFAEDCWVEQITKQPMHAQRMTEHTSAKGMGFYDLKATGREITFIREPSFIPRELHGVGVWGAGTQCQFIMKKEEA